MRTDFETLSLAGVLLRIAVAMVAGFILGFPFRHRPGGLRTHALVTTGAALFCILGVELAGDFNTDLSRIVQGVIQGIGFIGGATVLKTGGSIIGVNTAASVLLASSIGCFIGSGYPLLGLVISPLIMVFNVVLKQFEDRLEGDRKRRRLVESEGEKEDE
jgi:putative Mg2+ transporter-C (MgtC) family protein